MNEHVAVFHDGRCLTLMRLVADDLGHQHGDHLSTAEFWEAIGANAAAGIAHCNLMIAAKENGKDT